MRAEECQQFIQYIQNGVVRWEQSCAQVPLQALEWQPSQEKWSIKQITFHVADGFEATTLRIQHMLAEETPWILSFDADQWSRERSYQQRPWSDAMSCLRTGMERFIALVSPLNKTMLQRQGRQRNIANILGLPGEVLLVSDLIRFEALHVEEHFEGVTELIQLFAERTREVSS